VLLVISMPESYLSIGKLLATAMDEYLALRGQGAECKQEQPLRRSAKQL
jgi:hypothetical protein